MRFDRILTLTLRYLPRGFGAAAPAFPILMYHAITDDAEPTRSPYYKTNTSPAVFGAQMALLKKLGYRGLDLGSAFDAFAKNPHERVAALTFDDGYRDIYTHAFPVLERHGFTASVFLPTTYIANDRKRFKDRDCLTWSEVRELRGKGIAFGSHTMTHPQLHDLSPDQVRSEITGSLTAIERELGGRVMTFAYPYAFPDADVPFVRELTSVLRDAGIERSVTTRIGRATAAASPYTLPRLPVNGCDDDALFVAKLEGAYDWLARPQAWSKKLKGRRDRGLASPNCCKATT